MKVWDRICCAMMASPDSGPLLRTLEGALPKSQIVLASKPGATAPSGSAASWRSGPCLA